MNEDYVNGSRRIVCTYKNRKYTLRAEYYRPVVNSILEILTRPKVCVGYRTKTRPTLVEGLDVICTIMSTASYRLNNSL